MKSRSWISYQPYEAKDYSQDERVLGVTQPGTGGNVLLAGITTYVGLRPGMHVWVGADWDIARSTSSQFMPLGTHISFGITQHFRIHF